jgi:ATP-dependent exoDNAse (exonuclease V) alpha subunit
MDDPRPGQGPGPPGQFPLTVAFAVTVHKAQGMTVDQAALNIAGKDFVVGLTYVAVS